jgi:S-adenosylmethionine:tRNA ribosyltransferase-isomerase
VKTASLDYDLPSEQIAFHPSRVRRHCRLLKLDRSSGAVSHHRFDALPDLLLRGDLLVVNDTAVIPARLLGRKEPTGGRAEVFLLEKLSARRWRALVRPGARLRPGTVISFGTTRSSSFVARVGTSEEDGTRTVDFEGHGRFDDWLERVGRMPLPPYIARESEPRDRRDYQTVFARKAGAVAAPTAGLHFDQILLTELRRRRIGVASLTLHVGAGTFRPVRSENLEDHVVESERFSIGSRTMGQVGRRKATGRGRVIAVGTTVTRALETVAGNGVWETLVPGAGLPDSGERRRYLAVRGETDLFIRPGHGFRAIDGLITNFHLPRSSLLALVAALAGLGPVLRAYRVAVESGYRFYSYGDAMLIV